MSSAVLDRPAVESSEVEWVVLSEPPAPAWQTHASRGVTIRGYGTERHGLLRPGRATAAQRNLVVLPSIDDLD